MKAEGSCKTEKIHLRNLKKFMAEKGYDEILLRHVEVKFFDQYKTFRYRQEKTVVTVNKELGTFSVMLRKAVKYGHIPYNVVTDVDRDKSDVSPDRSGGQLKVDTLRERLVRLLKGTKFEGVGFYVLRRSYSSILASTSTAATRVIEKIMGHENSDMKIIYQHALPGAIEEAMKQVEIR